MVTQAKGRGLRRMRSDIGMIFQTFNLVKRSSCCATCWPGRLGDVHPLARPAGRCSPRPTWPTPTTACAASASPRRRSCAPTPCRAASSSASASPARWPRSLRSCWPTSRSPASTRRPRTRCCATSSASPARTGSPRSSTCTSSTWPASTPTASSGCATASSSSTAPPTRPRTRRSRTSTGARSTSRRTCVDFLTPPRVPLRSSFASRLLNWSTWAVLAGLFVVALQQTGFDVERAHDGQPGLRALLPPPGARLDGPATDLAPAPRDAADRLPGDAHGHGARPAAHLPRLVQHHDQRPGHVGRPQRPHRAAQHPRPAVRGDPGAHPGARAAARRHRPDDLHDGRPRQARPPRRSSRSTPARWRPCARSAPGATASSCTACCRRSRRR